ncbi:MAG TPA: MrpF/PhaF family protein [Solirubrobacteraceae bacterium]|nr:MrpF/PhaF family protein [Solirubrobacteraceae bacterium]
MNGWLIAATILLAALLPLLVVALRSPVADALVAVELASVIATLALLLLAEGFHHNYLFDVALVMAVITFVGSLAYVRMLERWL